MSSTCFKYLLNGRAKRATLRQFWALIFLEVWCFGQNVMNLHHILASSTEKWFQVQFLGKMSLFTYKRPLKREYRSCYVFFSVLLQYNSEQQCTLLQFYTVHYLLQFVYYYQYGTGMLKHFWWETLDPHIFSWETVGTLFGPLHNSYLCLTLYESGEFIAFS